jgi:hypothetical protein
MRATYIASDWARVFHAYLDGTRRRDRTGAECLLHDDRFQAEVEAIWNSPVLTLHDLLSRVSIAINYNMPPDMPGYPDNVINDPRAKVYQKALAQVVRGVCELANLKFDSEGRVL